MSYPQLPVTNYQPRIDMVGKLALKNSEHWSKVNAGYWATNCGIELFVPSSIPHWMPGGVKSWKDKRVERHHIRTAMVKIQRELVNAAKLESGGTSMILAGELYKQWWNNKDIKVKTYHRCPFHSDILPNWEQFADDLSKVVLRIENFSIRNVMLPTSPFFSTKIMPVLRSNETTITDLVLENCNLQSSDIDPLSKFIKKNHILSILNLSQNDSLFGSDTDGSNAAAKQLAKAIKKHSLSYVNLSKTGLGDNNEALKIVLEGSRELKTLIIDDNAPDREGATIIKSFLEKKNALTVLSMGSFSIGSGDDAPSNAKLLKQCLMKNATLEQLCLGSNCLGSNDRVLSTIMSGIKGSASLSHIDLSGNELRKLSSMKLIATYLAGNPVLIDLDLGSNAIPTKSADALIKSLKKNTTLEHLSLKNNNITDKSVPAFTDALQKNTTLCLLDLENNNLKVKTGRKGMLKILCDTTSLESIANKSNHTCSIRIAGRNYGGTHEDEFNKINALENEGQKIRYKVVLAMCSMNKELYNPRTFDDIPLELMPLLLELVQQEMGCKGFGEEIVNSVRKRNTINRLNNVYEAIHQWPSFPSLFMRGPGKLKRKRNKRKLRVADEDEDWTPQNRASGW